MRHTRMSLPSRIRWPIVSGTVFLILEGRALAWTPSARTALSDLARTRLDALSFYAVGWLLCCAGFRLVWNVIAIGRPTWPRLTYRRTLLGSMILSVGLLAILTFLAGVWEVTSPGAWRRSSAAAHLSGAFALEPSELPSPLPRAGVGGDERRSRLETLRQHLWADARSRDGAFPASREDSSVPSDLWSQPGFPSVLYIYRPGLRLDGPSTPLVMEYELFDDGRWVLMTDGTIERSPSVTEPEAAATTEAGK